MPELPEIEALRASFAERLVGRRPVAVSVRQFALVKTFDPPLDALMGAACVGVGRHGKHLLFDFAGGLTLSIHLSIGGRIVPSPPAASSKLGRYVSLALFWDDDGRLDVVELGSKKRSAVHLLRTEAVASHLADLGIDARSADLTAARLAELLRGERSQLKHFLVDQHRIAGIGNAYSDEILWDARLAPLRLTTSLEEPEIEALQRAIHEVLDEATVRAGADNYLTVARGDERGVFRVHRRPGEPCPRCEEPIASIHFVDSSLQYCPACQVDGHRYADRRLSRLLR